ncbi:protease sohB [Candidatus Photodesmus katoptron]|uniref:Peptidase family S49 n=1 Tax=Candidatus Photodesmus katoptron Akat1 TaxID=1236703 RepID=S3EH02_9GAMM|nr:protease SohB [Candidatus Photodesmus katoptron]EPE37448.1 peptidase family S49 [Candidatus Photodesmus katoptron Akat1]KEY90218.1 protease sohB [Candidatus Photodesmus katoptron]
MEFLLNYSLFLTKIITIAVIIFTILLIIKGMNNKKNIMKGELEITDLTEQYKQTIEQLESHLHDEIFIKTRNKVNKQKEKEQAKLLKKKIKQNTKERCFDLKHEAHLFVLDFNGSIDAKEVDSLREEVTAILAVAQKGDEVLLKLETNGGTIPGYGLASSQLNRIKSFGLPLTISVDKVAASGGYMMACIADKIVSAPFSIVGSIGVIAQLPNFNKLLKKHNIEFEELTAGEYKRTLTMFGKNNEKARKKLKEELEEMHVLFKKFIHKNRPELDLEKVATGEHWFGIQAKELGLVDEIQTSDDLVTNACKNKTVLLIQFTKKKRFTDKLANITGKLVNSVLTQLINRKQNPMI